LNGEVGLYDEFKEDLNENEDDNFSRHFFNFGLITYQEYKIFEIKSLNEYSALALKDCFTAELNLEGY
jgi:hypothetical protein